MNKLNDIAKLEEKLNLEITGQENYPKGEPSIIIANHNCLMDIFLLPLSVDKKSVGLISSRLIYKNDLERQKVIEKYLYSLPIEVHGGSEYSDVGLQYAEKLLQSGKSIYMFPEGAYENGKNVFKGRTGAARILFSAAKKGMRPYLVPVAIDIKSEDIIDLDNYFANNDQVNISILPPIDYDECFDGYNNSSDDDERYFFLHKVVDDAMQKIAQALQKIYVDKYIPLQKRNNIMLPNGEEIPLEKKSEYLHLYVEDVKRRYLELVR